MSSDSGSNSGSERSVSPDQQLSARTPGYNLEGSRSNSPNLQKNNEIDNASGRSRSQSRSRESSKSRSRSNSGASNRSWHSQRSHSEGSHHSDRSKSPSDGSRRSRSRSVGSNLSEKSRSHMSRSGSSRSRSKTPVSVRSRSKTPASNRSRSKTPGSHRSRSKTPGSHRSRSKTPASNRSRSKTPTSIRSRSKTPASIRSHSKSPASNRSRSKTPASNRSRSHSKSGSVRSARSGSGDSNRSRSGDSHKSRSRSRSGESNKSRSRSRSVESQRSSAASNRSRSKSRSRSVSRSVSRSRSKSKSRSRSKSKDRSRSRSKSRSKSRSRSKSKDRSKSSSKSRSKSRSRSRSASVQKGEKIDGSIHSSGDEAKQKVYKRSKILDSDSDEGDNEKVEASAAALFGDADDISSEEEQQQQQQEEDIPDERRSDDEREARSDGENDQQVAVIEEEQEKEVEEPIPETRIDVEIPKISCDLGRDIHFVKLPNFLSVETRPFDPETYEDEIDEEETLDEEGRARLKLKVENTIRWKEELDKSGNLIKQSNARFVRWSDGSLSLHLGSEIFDVYKQPLQGDHNHLFIRQGTGLQGQAVFRTKLSFRPHSTESFTHRKMTLSLADRSQKTPGIKILSQVGLDPDQDRKTLLKKEEEKLRPVKAKPKKRGEGSVGRSHASNTTYREEEGSDEDGAISLNAIKNKYKGGQAPNKGGPIYSSDEEGSDIEARRARKLDKAKVLKDSESSDESE